MKIKIVHFIFAFVFLLPLSSLAGPADKIFKLETALKNHQVVATWTIAPDAYLYQSKFDFKLPDNKASLKPIAFPQAQMHADQDLGPQKIYKNQLTLTLEATLLDNTLKQLPLSIHYQGCSEQGFCYPPQTKQFTLTFDKGVITQIEPVLLAPANPNQDTKNLDNKNLDNPSQAINTNNTTLQNSPAAPKQDLLSVSSLLNNTHNKFTLFLGFFLLGVVLCFTPCVLPMVPMLSTLIIGKKNIKTPKAFSLSFVYVLSMALTYALAGVGAALVGQRIQTAFQSPWVLSMFAGLFVLLGLELAGHLNVSMPDFIRSRLYQLQSKPNSGTYLGAVALGILATLVASPCVSAPLMGVLGYITQTGDITVGGLSLFAIGLGMGTPLIIAGTLGGKYLPKAGKWMQLINELFAIVLFAFAIWIIERFAPHALIMGLWATLCLYIAHKMGVFNLKQAGLAPRMGTLFILSAGAFMFSLTPYFAQFNHHTPSALLSFNTLTSLSDLEHTLKEAKSNQQPTLVEFYADWCTSCKKMEKHTLNKTEVQSQLKNWHLVKANVTANTSNEQNLLKQFELIGPPSILFFDKNGVEQPHLRLTGEVTPAQLLEHLKKIEQS